jgi:hypothetical protein
MIQHSQPQSQSQAHISQPVRRQSYPQPQGQMPGQGWQ